MAVELFEPLFELFKRLFKPFKCLFQNLNTVNTEKQREEFMSEVAIQYPTNGANERLMYANIDVKVGNYQGKYAFLTDDSLEKIHAMCRTFNRVLRQARI